MKRILEVLKGPGNSAHEMPVNTAISGSGKENCGIVETIISQTKNKLLKNSGVELLGFPEITGLINFYYRGLRKLIPESGEKDINKKALAEIVFPAIGKLEKHIFAIPESKRKNISEITATMLFEICGRLEKDFKNTAAAVSLCRTVEKYVAQMKPDEDSFTHDLLQKLKGKFKVKTKDKKPKKADSGNHYFFRWCDAALAEFCYQCWNYDMVRNYKILSQIFERKHSPLLKIFLYPDSITLLVVVLIKFMEAEIIQVRVNKGFWSALAHHLFYDKDTRVKTSLCKVYKMIIDNREDYAREFKKADEIFDLVKKKHDDDEKLLGK